MGVNNIYVSGLIFRKQRSFDNIIRDINLAIRLISSTEGFIFIPNDNITRSDLHGDGLHLNPEGTEKLLENILSYTCPSFWLKGLTIPISTSNQNINAINLIMPKEPINQNSTQTVNGTPEKIGIPQSFESPMVGYNSFSCNTPKCNEISTQY